MWYCVSTGSRFSRHFAAEKMHGGNFVANEVVEEFLGHSNLTSRWPDWSPMKVDENFLDYTSLMEYPNSYSIIVANNIPDEIVVRAFEAHNAMFVNTGIAFADEDIAALLTRCEAAVLRHFATERALVIEDRIYTLAWIYRNTTEGYRAAGITPEMLAEKLPMYAEFGFTDEATAAFESKLTEFVGVEVSFAEIARDSGVAQNRS
jgi:hypothetical protein